MTRRRRWPRPRSARASRAGAWPSPPARGRRGRSGGASRPPTRRPPGRASPPPRARCAPARAPGRRGSAPRAAGDRGARLCGLRHPIPIYPRRRVVLSARWTEVVDAGRRLHGDVHAAARHHDRERRAAVDRARPRRRPRRPAVGRRRLRAHARGAAADGRLARRPRRPPARVPDRPRRLHRRLGAVRARRRRRCTLNLARGLQGVGGAFMFATSLALLASAYSGRDRGTALGLWGATTGAAVAVGPLVGGVLTEGIGWEAIFFVNVPIGIARRRAHARARGGVQEPARRALGLARHGAVLRRAVPADLRPDPRQPGGLGAAPPIVAVAGRRGRAAGRVRGGREPQRARRCSTSPCSGVPRSTAPRSPPSCCRRRCSRCSSTSRSTSRTSSATARWSPACASCR